MNHWKAKGAGHFAPSALGYYKKKEGKCILKEIYETDSTEARHGRKCKDVMLWKENRIHARKRIIVDRDPPSHLLFRSSWLSSGDVRCNGYRNKAEHHEENVLALTEIPRRHSQPPVVHYDFSNPRKKQKKGTVEDTWIKVGPKCFYSTYSLTPYECLSFPHLLPFVLLGLPNLKHKTSIMMFQTIAKELLLTKVKAWLHWTRSSFTAPHANFSAPSAILFKKARLPISSSDIKTKLGSLLDLTRKQKCPTYYSKIQLAATNLEATTTMTDPKISRELNR